MGVYWGGHLSTAQPEIVPVVFLDRDGVINRLALDQRSGKFESPYRPDDVELNEGIGDAFRVLREVAQHIVVVSNQPAAAKGTASLSELAAVHDEVVRQLGAAGASADAFLYCHHHPEGVVPELTGPCQCRKPAPGMVLQAASDFRVATLRDCWLLGDSDVDIAAATAVGMQSVLVEEPMSAHRRSSRARPTHRAPSVLSAAAIVADRVHQATSGEA